MLNNPPIKRLAQNNIQENLVTFKIQSLPLDKKTFRKATQNTVKLASRFELDFLSGIREGNVDCDSTLGQQEFTTV